MKKQNKKILITGGAGYIGLNFIFYFLEEKYQICVIDNLSTSQPINKLIKKKIKFFNIDLTNENKVKNFFRKKNFDLIIHLAAFSGVQDFNKNVLKSFNNNVLSTKNLIRHAFNSNKTKFILASSAAVYGKVSQNKVDENHKCEPVNYYGLSKYVCEKIVKNELEKRKIHYGILRYFNVVGSKVNFKIKKKIKSLFDIINENIKEKKYKININGNNLKTKDGTPERDFIHIKDLYLIHKKAFLYLRKNKKIIINCGSGYRHSVLEVVKGSEKIVGKKFKITFKKTNIDETETICSNNRQLKNLLKINIKKNKIYHFLTDYFGH